MRPRPSIGEEAGHETACRAEGSDGADQAIANAFSRISFRGEGDAPIFQPSLINVPISVSAPCTNGGRVGITGSMTGNDPVGSTFTLLMQITATLTDCREGNLVINGDPYLSTAGTFRSTASIFNGDMRSGGGCVRDGRGIGA